MDHGRDLDSALSWNVESNSDLTDDSLLKLHVSQAIEQFSLGNEKEASDHIKSAIDDGYTNPAAYFLLGYLYINIGQDGKRCPLARQISITRRFCAGITIADGQSLQQQQSSGLKPARNILKLCVLPIPRWLTRKMWRI